MDEITRKIAIKKQKITAYKDYSLQTAIFSEKCINYTLIQSALDNAA